MSMTTEYLLSLPAAEQDAILGGIDNAYISPDEENAEWARALMEEGDDEASDPLVKCRICRRTWPISEMNTSGECPDCQLEQKEAAALDADIKRSHERLEQRKKDVEDWTRHIENLEARKLRLLAELERENALLVRPEGKCVTLESNGVEWKL